MSQQQLLESQLPLKIEALIETESKFRNAQTANKSTEGTKQIKITKTIPHSRNKLSNQPKIWCRHNETALPIYRNNSSQEYNSR